MAFDIRTAKPLGETKSKGFDISSAKPLTPEIKKPTGETPAQIYYNFVASRTPLPEIRASLKAAGMEFDPRLYREALMSITQTPEAVEAQQVGTAKVVESGLRGGVGGGAAMAEGISQLVPGETATDVAAFFREQERKQREAAPISEVYSGAKAITETMPYVGVAGKVAKAKSLATPFRQLIAQPLTQAAATYALTPERGEPTLSGLVTGEAKEPEGALFGLAPTTGSTKLDEALTALTLTGLVELPFAGYSGYRKLFPKGEGRPPGPEERAAYNIYKEREAALAGGDEAKGLDEQILAAKQQEELRRKELEELQRKNAEEAARRQQEAARVEAERAARQQALVEQRRQAEIAEQEAKRAAQDRITQAQEKSEQIKETAEAEAERLRLESAAPDKQFPDEDEILRQERINDAAVQASGTLENAAAKLEAQAAKRESEAAATTSVGETKMYDLGDRVRQIFLDTRKKLVEARDKAIGKGAEAKKPEEGRNLLPHEKDVEARGGNLTGTQEFKDFSTFIKNKVEDKELTPPLKRVYKYVQRIINTGKEGTNPVPWQRLRYLRREVADKLSPTQAVSFDALTQELNSELVGKIDDLLDAFVGGTKEAPGSYKGFLSAYREESKPLDIFKFGPGKIGTEMGEWGKGLEYDREDVIKAVMHPTRSNAETVVELAGDKVGDLAEIVRSALLKQAGGSAKKLRDTLDKYNEFLSVDAFSGVRNDLENLARTSKLNEGIAARLKKRAEKLKSAAEDVNKLPRDIRSLLTARDFVSDDALTKLTTFLNANPTSREGVSKALTSLVDGMPDEQIVLALSNPAKRASLVRAGLPVEEADNLLQKANSAINERAAKIQESKQVKREARKEGRKVRAEARAPVTEERQKVRELGAEISKIGAERRAAVGAERAITAEARAAEAGARAPVREAKRLRIDLEQKRKALSDINEQPELAESIVNAAADIPVNTTEGLINATVLGTIYSNTAQIVSGSPLLSAIAGAIGVKQALTQRAAKMAMLGRNSEAIRSRIKSELQQIIDSKLKREEVRQVIENYDRVMDAQRKSNEILKLLGVIPGATAATSRKIYEAYGDAGAEEAAAEETEEPAETSEINQAITSQNAEGLRPLVESIYEQESSSGRNPEAEKENYAGAAGGMQVTPIAFKEVQDKGYLPKDYSLDNPQHRLEAGVAYIRYLADMYDNDPEKIAAAYYGGPSAVADGEILRNRRDPQNPKAPTVGEYVDKVLARIMPTAEARGMADGGLITPGNIDVSKLPAVRNPDGTVSTVRSMSINVDGKEVLIPTVVNGRVVSEKEAIDQYMKTRRHLGIFNTPEAATAYAQKLHELEAQRVKKARGGYTPAEEVLLRRYSSR
jgi:soluble lytic murein transglycosylase-like protein